MFNLLEESHILIYPPVNAVLACVVWEYRLPWPNLQKKEYMKTVCLGAMQLKTDANKIVGKSVWYPLCEQCFMFS